MHSACKPQPLASCPNGTGLPAMMMPSYQQKTVATIASSFGLLQKPESRFTLG